MKPGFLQTSYPKNEDRRIASILVKIIFAMLAAYLVIILTALYWRDFTLLANLSTVAAVLSVPWMLPARIQADQRMYADKVIRKPKKKA